MKDKSTKEEKKKKIKPCECGDECECGCNEGEDCTCESCNGCNHDKHECDGCECDNCEFDIEGLQKTITDLQNKLIYKEAELVNYRKRKDEEVTGLLKYANQDLILDILKSIDNFERAITSVESDEGNKNILTGLNMVYNELLNTLKKYGVEEIPALNQEFDHNIHNAVMTDNNEEFENDVITEVMQKGYKLKNRVIRPAMVKVNKLD